MQKALVSVTGVDKPGIIARVSTALFEMNINVLEISQTILDGYFTMLMIVDITNATAAFSEAAARMEEVGHELGEAISIQPVSYTHLLSGVLRQSVLPWSAAGCSP